MAGPVRQTACRNGHSQERGHDIVALPLVCRRDAVLHQHAQIAKTVRDRWIAVMQVRRRADDDLHAFYRDDGRSLSAADVRERVAWPLKPEDIRAPLFF